jgi:hypothetical protein
MALVLEHLYVGLALTAGAMIAELPNIVTWPDIMNEMKI